MRLKVLLDEVRACTICAPDLPNDPNPLVQGSARSRLLIIGQAPGAAADKTGVPWDDRSGDRLRDWLGLSPDAFYDEQRVALMPMGFCFPGKGRSGDLAPRPECAPQWHQSLLNEFTGVRFTIFVGQYAFKRYLADQYTSLTSATQAHSDLLPKRIALPHPSPRNNIWLRRNPWFEEECLPALQKRVRSALRAK